MTISASAADGWRRACPVERLLSGDPAVAEQCPTVAVYAVAGEYFATDDLCSHGRSSLSEGLLEGAEIECVLHAARFDVRTGEALSAPASTALRTYPTKVEDGVLYVHETPRTTP